MLTGILSGFLLAPLAPALHRLFPRYSGWLLALLPAGLTLYFFLQWLPVTQQGPQLTHIDWVPALAMPLSFMLDGLSLLFALMICAIGALIFIYAGRYLEGHRDLPRLYVLLLCFMAAMLGVVLSDNLIVLFVFWELTSITSYLLIGFNHEDANARAKALQGLIVTVGGGLALMTGFILLGHIGGSYELSELITRGDTIVAHPLYGLTLVLIVLGAFTKSAQFPFHFWLPNAMAAPTPVSAYLHSATMVKAGIYLLARLHPAMGGTELWLLLLGSAGAITMVLGIFLALRATGIKRMLAYSTVMALGTLTLLIGLGTRTAMLAAMSYLLAHSLYKGALFMVAGIIDHQTGRKDFLDTGGWARYLPVTSASAGLAALSLAGVMPLFGFIAKEQLLEAGLRHGHALAPLFIAAIVIAAALGVAVAAVIAIRPWFGKPAPLTHTPSEAPPAMLLGPALLASLGLLLGLIPGLIDRSLLSAAASATLGEAVTQPLALWHGINTALLISIGAVLVGLVLFRYWQGFRHYTRWAETLSRCGPEQAYHRLMDGLVALSSGQTRLLQSGYLRYYLISTLLTLVAMVAAALWLNPDALKLHLDFSDIQLHEGVIAAVLVSATLAAVTLQSRLGAVASLGAVGFSIALLYVLFSAPDLSITQVLVETLTVIMLVLVLFRLPGFLRLTRTRTRLADALVGLTVGGMVTALLLSVLGSRYHGSIAHYFINESVPAGYGRNIVNVILVDFRALDTLGEIFVLALAATGVYAMLKLRSKGDTTEPEKTHD